MGYHTNKYMATKMIDVDMANWYYSANGRIIYVWGKHNHKTILRIMQSKYFDGKFKLIPLSEPLQHEST